MPDGNYDIFIIPPHSAGSGFLYLPSLGTQRNSFLAGVACTLLAVGVYTLVMPVLREWMSTVMASGGVGVLLLVVGVGVAGWAWGKTQEEWNRRDDAAGAGSASAGTGTGPQQHSQQQAPPPPPQHEAPPPPPPPEPPKPEPRPPPPKPSAASGWEKAREETRKREEARKREEELKKVREELQRKREEAEKAAKAKAEKEKWEQVRAREKERREREARERIQREREAKQNAEKNKAGSAPAASTRPSPTKPSANYARPTAKSYVGTEESYSYRPYDTAKTHTHKSSASSISGLSESSYAPSATTARTTPPPSQRGPYSTKDPDKIQIKAVYLFSDSFPNKPISSLISNQPPVTDGLVLRITSAGLFIDDDIRGVPQREWDVKAWTVKLVEDGVARGVGDGGNGLHVLRATTRDAENKRYTFVLEETEAWKVAVGLARLRKGSQPKVLGMGSGGMKESEVKNLLSSLGWL